jgi:probable addiction module antidote protein
MPRHQNYKADLLADLRGDGRFATEYVSAAYADSQEAFLVPLRDVAEAQVGIASVAKEANVNRENLYRTLSKEGNPRLSTLGAVLSALGMDLIVRLKNAPADVDPQPRKFASEIIVTGATSPGASHSSVVVKGKPLSYISGCASPALGALTGIEQKNPTATAA